MFIQDEVQIVLFRRKILFRYAIKYSALWDTCQEAAIFSLLQVLELEYLMLRSSMFETHTK
jgi:hypothetical protein